MMNFSGDFSTQEEENEREEKKQESEEKRSKFLSVVYPGYSTSFFFFIHSLVSYFLIPYHSHR